MGTNKDAKWIYISIVISFMAIACAVYDLCARWFNWSDTFWLIVLTWWLGDNCYKLWKVRHPSDK